MSYTDIYPSDRIQVVGLHITTDSWTAYKRAWHPMSHSCPSGRYWCRTDLWTVRHSTRVHLLLLITHRTLTLPSQTAGTIKRNSAQDILTFRNTQQLLHLVRTYNHTSLQSAYWLYDVCYNALGQSLTKMFLCHIFTCWRVRSPSRNLQAGLQEGLCRQATWFFLVGSHLEAHCHSSVIHR